MPAERVAAEERQTSEDLAADDDENWLYDDNVVYEIETETLYRSNSGEGYRSAVTMRANSFEYDSARLIVQTIRDSWNKQTFTSDGCKITTCLADDTTTEQDEEESIWQGIINLRINHSTA